MGRRIHFYILALGLALAQLLAGCAQTTPTRRYYALNSVPAPERSSEPIPMDVWFRGVDVGPTYNRPQIVYRYSQHELQYFANRLWADRPERMIKDVMFRSLYEARIFESFEDRVSDDLPTHVFSVTVDAIEEQVGIGVNFAHLSMVLRLSTYNGNQEVWRYRIDRTRQIPQDDTEALVRAISEILQQELIRAQRSLLNTFGDGAPTPKQKAQALKPERGKLPPAEGPTEGHVDYSPTVEKLLELEGEGVEIPHPSEWMESLQYNRDDTRLPAGMGAIFVPALSGDGDREPTVRIQQGRAEEGEEALTFDDEGENSMTGQTGQRIAVEPGIYTVLLGSGAIGQRMRQEVAVIQGRVTVIEPFWSALDVQVLDSRFVAVREAYELFQMDQRGYYGTGVGGDAGVGEQGYFGTGFGANAELGEQTRIWLLEPGLYKLVQPGANYRARTNFATVYVLSGEMTRFNLVVDQESGDFLGAGVMSQQDISSEEVITEAPPPWQTSLSVGGDFLLAQSSASVGVQQGTSVNVNLFADSLAQYRNGPHRWISRGELEEGQIRQRARGFRTQTDRLYLHSIYLYDFNESFGPYGRIGAETSLLPRTYYLDAEEPVDVPVLDPSGEQVDLLSDQLSFQLAPALSPLNLREGAGVNYVVLRTEPLELNARLGLGARQFLVRQGYVLTPLTEDSELVGVQQVYGTQIAGIEMMLLATARVGRMVQIRSEFDALVPRPISQTYFEWRTITTLRLSSYASLNYRLELSRDTNQSLEQPMAITNILQLQFFYKPF